MSFTSISASIREPKVSAGMAANIDSDRYLNSGNAVCVPWSGYDSAGREVTANTYNTRSAGCNSAHDQVSTENYLRPNYSSYVNLNTEGIEGGMYSQMETPLANKSEVAGSYNIQKLSNIQQQYRQYSYGNSAYKSKMRSLESSGEPATCGWTDRPLMAQRSNNRYN